MSQPFFDFKDVNFTYPGGRIALDHLSLKIEQGEFVGIVGANGSGKTTLARHLNALLTPTTGSVRVNGFDTSLKVNWPTIHSQVGMVFQFPEDQIVASTVEEDTAFGPENLGLPPLEIRSRVEAALTEVGMWEHRKRAPHLLSAGQMQRLALAGVLAMHPKAVVFDEATTMLDPYGRRRAMSAMKTLNDDGETIVFITHFMDEAVNANRIVVLDHGRVVIDGTREEVFSHPADLVNLGLELPVPAQISMILRQAFPWLKASILTEDELVDDVLLFFGHAPTIPNLDQEKIIPPSQDKIPLIAVENLNHTYLGGTPLAFQALNNVSLMVGESESRGLAGTTGSGKSTLLQHLNGLLRPQSGRVRIGKLNLNDPKVTIRSVIQQVGLVFQNPEATFFERFTGDEIAYGPRQMISDHYGGKGNLEYNRREIRKRVQDAMEIVGLDFESFKDRPTDTLSGGERRKVALAAIVALQPPILAMDEPTAGLDPVSKNNIVKNLFDLKKSGKSLVIASHQMDVLAALSDYLSVMRSGKVNLDGTSGDIFDRPEDLKPLNLEPPTPTRIAHKLRQAGWQLPKGILSINNLTESIISINTGSIRQ